MSEKNISIVQRKNNAYTNAAAKLFARVGAVLSCMAFILLIGEGFASVKNYIIIAIGSTVVCACSLFLEKNKIGQYIAPGFFTASVITALLLNDIAKNGMLLMANDFLDFLSLKTGKIYLDFSIEGFALPELVFTVISMFAVLLLSISVSLKNILPALPVIIIAAIGCSCGFLSTGIYLFLLFIGILLIFLGIFIPENRSFAGIKAAAAIIAFVLICCAISIIPAYFTEGKNEELHCFINDSVHSLLYDSRSNSMPEGKLKNIGDRKSVV